MSVNWNWAVRSVRSLFADFLALGFLPSLSCLGSEMELKSPPIMLLSSVVRQLCRLL